MIKGIRQKKDEKESFGKIIERMQLSSVSVKVKSLILDIEQLMIQNFYSSKFKFLLFILDPTYARKI
jgi:hypothetical protein